MSSDSDDYVETSDNAFSSYPDFCSHCGALLELPASAGKFVTCVVCKHKSHFTGLVGVASSYTLDFTPLGYYASMKKQVDAENKKGKKQDAGELGQMDNDRECGKCGNIGMSYTTMQLRSADEGQTVFYFCPKCKSREVENS